MHEDEIPVGRAKDLRGQKFGKLTVLYRVKDKGKTSAWKCQCDCGQKTIVRTDCLNNGQTRSCGCLQKETAAHLARTLGNKNFLDLTGQRFGKLVALKPINKGANEGIKWECQCDCGNNIIVAATALRANLTKSCGCIKQSYGEELINQLLQQYNLSFEREKIFNNCKWKALCRFDFYVNNTYLIEFDGKQHFEITPYFGGEKTLLETQQRDAYKNQWCKENNIPLIRIPYTKLNTLCIEDLLLETTEFRVV